MDGTHRQGRKLLRSDGSQVGWAESWVKRECNETMEEFMNTYTWDQTYNMRLFAERYDVLLASKIVGRGESVAQ